MSYAQNGEDVVLWRALGDLPPGHYVDVGANDPTVDSVTRAFYDRGWTGINIEPMSACAEALRAERPKDSNIEAAIAEDPGIVTLYELLGTGLSTIVDEVAAGQGDLPYKKVKREVPAYRLDTVLEESGWEPGDIQFLKVDVEGAEDQVLRSVDLSLWKPWILVMESTAPNSSEPVYEHWEPLVLASGYQLCLFDGLSRYYVHADHEELVAALSYPACPVDDYVRYRELTLEDGLNDAHRRLQASVAAEDLARREADELRSTVMFWRGQAVSAWAVPPAADERVEQIADENKALRREIKATRETLSWRVTKPLRFVRSFGKQEP